MTWSCGVIIFQPSSLTYHIKFQNRLTPAVTIYVRCKLLLFEFFRTVTHKKNVNTVSNKNAGNLLTRHHWWLVQYDHYSHFLYSLACDLCGPSKNNHSVPTAPRTKVCLDKRVLLSTSLLIEIFLFCHLKIYNFCKKLYY